MDTWDSAAGNGAEVIYSSQRCIYLGDVFSQMIKSAYLLI